MADRNPKRHLQIINVRKILFKTLFKANFKCLFYSQFENVALDAVFELLNSTNARGRDSAREVARRLSALVGTDAFVRRSSTGKSF